MRPSSKHSLITLGRIVHAGTSNFLRNAWLSTAATAIMTVTLSILLATIAINIALNDTVEYIAEDVNLAIHLKDDAPEQKVNALQVALTGNEEVASVEYKSKQQALDEFLSRDQNREDTTVLQSFDIVGNVLPASFVVTPKDLTQTDSIVATAQSGEYSDTVDKINQSRLDSLSNIGAAQRFVTRTGVIIGITFGTISILVIFNTIRMAIFTRSGEITIMRLIGATNGYIRGPFLFESILYGIVAATLATALTYTTLMTLGPRANRYVYSEPTITLVDQYWPVILLGTISVGMFIGIISSSLAMARYMKR